MDHLSTRSFASSSRSGKQIYLDVVNDYNVWATRRKSSANSKKKFHKKTKSSMGDRTFITSYTSNKPKKYPPSLSSNLHKASKPVMPGTTKSRVSRAYTSFDKSFRKGGYKPPSTARTKGTTMGIKHRSITRIQPLTVKTKDNNNNYYVKKETKLTSPKSMAKGLKVPILNNENKANNKHSITMK